MIGRSSTPKAGLHAVLSLVVVVAVMMISIAHHVDIATNGKKFGQLPNVATSDGKAYSVEESLLRSTDGAEETAGESLSATDTTTYSTRLVAQTVPSLQADLMVSLISSGLATTIAGLGSLHILASVTLTLTTRMSVLME